MPFHSPHPPWCSGTNDWRSHEFGCRTGRPSGCSWSSGHGQCRCFRPPLSGSTGHVYAQQFIFYAAFHSIFNIHPDCSSAVEATSGFKLRKAGSVPRRGIGNGDPARGVYPSCCPRRPTLAAAVRIFAPKTANTQYADSKFSAKRSQQSKCYQSSVCPATATQQKWRRQWRPEVKRRRRAGHQLGQLGTLGLRPHTSLVDGCISPSRGSAFFKSQKAAQRP